MGRVVILGGGVSGHTAASFCKKWLGNKHEVVVVTPNKLWNWVPSNIWVGIGRMTTEQVTFDLADVYLKEGITYIQAKATEIYPEGDATHPSPKIKFERTCEEHKGQEGFCERVGRYQVEGDFLVDEILWVNPENNVECSKDPDMQQGKKAKTKMTFEGGRMYLHLFLNHDPFIYIWKKIGPRD